MLLDYLSTRLPISTLVCTKWHLLLIGHMKIIMTNHSQEAVFKNYRVSLSSTGNQTSTVSQATLKILQRMNGENSCLLFK